MKEIVKLGNSDKHILFIPGGNIDIHCYDSLLRELSSHYTVEGVNLIELGTSDLSESKKWIGNYINECSYPTVIVAHSLGADIAKKIQSPKVSKYILMNSSIYDPNYSKVKVIFITVLKSLIAPLKYPRLFFFYILANYYLLQNLVTKPRKTIRHIKQALSNVTNELEITNPNEKMKVVASKDDEYFPNPRQTNVQLVDGNHEWLMNDTQKSSELIQSLINS
ncbi:MAG TPA: hypothetical protein VHA74_03225 [Candidatus Dojkabacteria bacterium]|nr:hypothetical protein [Candidatus Dojkabacteria bacterium]